MTVARLIVTVVDFDFNLIARLSSLALWFLLISEELCCLRTIRGRIYMKLDNRKEILQSCS